MAAPTMTFNTAGNLRSSASLAASGTSTHDFDLSAKIEGQVTVLNTPGGTVAATRGVRVEFLPRYGSTPDTTTLPTVSYTLPSQTASTAESRTFYLGTGKWRMRLTNVDATNAVTVAATLDTVDGIG